MVLFVGSKSFKSELQQTLNSLVTDPESAVRRSIGMGFHEVRRQPIKSHFSFYKISVSTKFHCFRLSNFWGAAVFSFSTIGYYCFATVNSRLLSYPCSFAQCSRSSYVVSCWFCWQVFQGVVAHFPETFDFYVKCLNNSTTHFETKVSNCCDCWSEYSTVDAAIFTHRYIIFVLYSNRPYTRTSCRRCCSAKYRSAAPTTGECTHNSSNSCPASAAVCPAISSTASLFRSSSGD